MDKRSFLKSLSLIGLGSATPAFSLDRWISKHEHVSPGLLAADEDFWEGIRKGYRLKEDYINLENGYYCFLPQETLEKYIGHLREINLQASYYMRTVQFDNKRKMAGKLAAVIGGLEEEVGITRNTTESLDLIIGGLDWKEGDEAVMAEQDYGTMLNMFRQVAARHGVVNKFINIPLHPKNDEEIVEVYAAAITGKTRLVMLPHIVNITGQIMPVRKIADMAHAKGALVMVDGAHAVGHFRFNINDLHCDFYGSSLHKWLSVPLGSGLLWVKKENISKVIWPLLSAGDKKPDDITRLNWLGTHPVHTDLAIADAIDYYNMIGPERKEARLRYLQSYWTSKLRKVPNVIINTPEDPARHCGIGNVGVTTVKPGDLGDILMKKYKIFTVPIDGAGVHGLRVTPNVYTRPAELDKLVTAVTEIARG